MRKLSIGRTWPASARREASGSVGKALRVGEASEQTPRAGEKGGVAHPALGQPVDETVVEVRVSSGIGHACADISDQPGVDGPGPRRRIGARAREKGGCRRQPSPHGRGP